MKNVTSFKLSIDRSRAPKKMGTLKDVSLFATDGEYGGGIIAKAMELDKSLEKPRTKCRRLHQENLAWPMLLGLLSPTNYLKLWKEIHRSPLHRSFTASDLSAMLQNQYNFLLWRSTRNNHLLFSPPSGYALKKNSGIHSSPEGDHDSFFTTGRPLLALELTHKML